MSAYLFIYSFIYLYKSHTYTLRMQNELCFEMFVNNRKSIWKDTMKVPTFHIFWYRKLPSFPLFCIQFISYFSRRILSVILSFHFSYLARRGHGSSKITSSTFDTNFAATWTEIRHRPDRSTLNYYTADIVNSKRSVCHLHFYFFPFFLT